MIPPKTYFTYLGYIHTLGDHNIEEKNSFEKFNF